MLTLGPLAFLNPWLLTALAALPVLWILLRATPPAPRRQVFPGVRLLLGLRDEERMPDRTPWWLLLLRLAMIAALIVAFARPVLNPARPLAEGSGPVLVLMDGGWASAPDWEDRRARALEAVEQADRAGRPVAFRRIAAPVGPGDPLELRAAGDWRGAVEAATPFPWAPDRAGFIPAVEAFAARPAAEGLSIVYLHDGLAHEEADGLADALTAIAPTTMIGPGRTALALRPPTLTDGALTATALRAQGGAERAVAAVAIGRSPEGADRRLARAEALFAEGETEATLVFDLPLELRNNTRRIALLSGASAGGVTLADDAVRRKRVGLLSGAAEDGARPLTSQLHFLRQALVPTAEVMEGLVPEMIETGADALILADIGAFPDEERAALTEWVEGGGLLVRFAGPRLARAEAERRDLEEDPLLPVRLRAGGRAVGGAMSWGAPQPIAAFPEASPFAGLTPPADVSVSRQVLAQPGPDVAARTIASLADGTPLVTMVQRGEGRVVLFHVTANAEWSSLPLSGLFVQMLERLALAAGTGGADAAAADPELTWTPTVVLDGFGREADADRAAGVPGARLAEGRPGPDAPPGIYQAGARALAHNVTGPETVLALAPPPPPSASADSLGRAEERDLKGPLLALAALLLALDAAASLWVSGRLPRIGARAAGLALAAGLGLAAVGEARAQALPPEVEAQRLPMQLAQVPGVDTPAFGTGEPPAGAAEAARRRSEDARAIAATTDTVLAYVITGDAAVDRMSEAGLRGLSRVLASRTAVEPADPIGVDLERDELAFYPMIYWPVSPGQATPSDAAYEKLNAFTRTGGMIVFDTRDAHLSAGMGGGTPEGRALRRLAAALDLPPLEPTPQDHVLTRTFYLLNDFPGRWTGGETWLEAAVEPDAAEGRPFRNLNDGVTPVIIGANDWAAAWAVDSSGSFLAPTTSLRQREMAFRFGVNLVMYVLTGSYKSDQVHVPALLERLEN
ncbi:DUF4159 domain-containing protein [Rhodovulum sp. DZ06]|uniref:DUF4159 domain-containing protein n=1 Tax=Rhodovulum sp. DZ06 TaxID=3425126 RepID=UPI003D3412E9